jgi:hypothetical protein
MQLTSYELYFILSAYGVDSYTEKYVVQQMKNLVHSVLTAVAKELQTSGYHVLQLTTILLRGHLVAKFPLCLRESVFGMQTQLH